MEGQAGSSEPEPVLLRAVVDTSILYPPYLRDTLLLLAENELYQPIWSATILDELCRTVLKFGTNAARVERTIELMGRQFPRAEHSVPQTLIDQMTNAPEDRHVAALALSAGAGMIVTANLRDLPRRSLAPHGIVARSPNQVLVQLVGAEPDRCWRVVADQAARY